MNTDAERRDLLKLSARLGRDPLLVQASSGNTSIKLDGTLWIKASGKWLANATNEEMLVPIELERVRENLRAGDDFTGTGAWVNGNYLRASTETATHAVLPHPVVIHVHSVNAISWAVRLDAPSRLKERLAGLRWCWIPYVSSGLPLARSIEQAFETEAGADVFVLANHGLVICGETCDAAENLLTEVERRLAVPVRVKSCGDEVSRRILTGGILYPCQAIFLGDKHTAAFTIEDQGIVADRKLTASQLCVLHGLQQVVRRIDAAAPIRYLSDAEVSALLNEDAHGYQLCTEKNAALVPKLVVS
jgi:ribulose-5-phosphate 4-epimerase/fuculose-1-phosphate aldolase